MIKIKVPATSANIGSGFDSLGVALDLYNYITFQESDKLKITSNLPVLKNKQNLIYKCAKRVYDICGKPLGGLEIDEEIHIPMTRGLGSSSACTVAGIMGANALLKNPLSKQEVINLAATIEGHPDNSTPAIVGGFAAAVFKNGKVYYQRAGIAKKVAFVAFIPKFELKTKVARAAIPKEIPHSAAVFNLSRAALLSLALFSGNLHNIKEAVADKLHQPYRFPMIKNSEKLIKLTYEHGALGTYLSGAGPTIISMIHADDTGFFDRVSAAVAEKYSAFEPVYLQACDTGAKVIQTV